MNENLNEQDYGTRTFNDIIEVYDFLKLPEAESLVPINPQRWPVHIARSILGQDLNNADSLVAKPFPNLLVTKEYLTTSHNRTHFSNRAKEVFVDTVRINGLSECGGLQGATVSGPYANWAANKYKIQMGVN